jgi:O-antigen/teichoic acid export membrane protein
MAINQIRAGVVLNYVVIGLNALVGLLYTPYMLRMMGQSEYGLYSIAASVIAYLTIMDFGFGNAIIRYTAKFRAEGRTEEQSSMFGMFSLLYMVIGAIALIIGGVVCLNVESLFGATMSAEELSRASTILAIMTVNLALSFPMGIMCCLMLRPAVTNRICWHRIFLVFVCWLTEIASRQDVGRFAVLGVIL